MVGDRANALDEQSAIAAAQNQGLLDRLAIARARVAELERREATLTSELDNYRTEFLASIKALQADVSGHFIFAPARIAALISTLNVVQRRDLWLSAVADLPLPPQWRALYPHAGGQDRIRVLVCGSGGYGDMLYLTMVARAIYDRFDAPEIFVVHEHPGAASVFDNNYYITAASTIGSSHISLLLNASASLDIFDLVVDVRYAISYSSPPLSRIPQAFILEASSRSIEWQKFCRDDWPFINNIFAKEIVKRGFNQYSFSEYTSNIHFDNKYYGVIFPSDRLDDCYASLLKMPYITIHHGSDRNMAGLNGLQTKNLPASTWAAIVEQIGETNFAVVQLGESHEELIPGAIIDLRGKLSLAETSLVLKYAQVHIDTEGGLVHLARAVGTKSVVAFGPTPPSFFGYKENINLAPPECGDCWWTTTTWATACPRGFSQPPCMMGHDAAPIAKAAISVARRQKTIEIASLKQRTTGQGPRWHTQLTEWANSSAHGFALICSAESLDVISASAWRGFRCYAVPRLFETLSARDAVSPTRPSVMWHIDEATDSVEFAIVEVPAEADPREIAAAVGELARTVRSGGIATLSFHIGSTASLSDLVAAIGMLPGGRAALTRKSTLDASTTLAGHDIELSFGEFALTIPSVGSRAIQRIFRKQPI